MRRGTCYGIAMGTTPSRVVVRPAPDTIRSVWVVAFSIALSAKPAAACMSFYELNQPMPPLVAERALVAFDEASHREHLVRSVLFADTPGAIGPPRPIGFVVPTPSIPEVAEADPQLFDRLEEFGKPAQITRTVHPIRWSLLTRSSDDARAIVVAPQAVEALSTAHVAGYDAVSLRADDPAVLSRWLREHGFVDRVSTAAWLAPYVQKRWILTAFRFAPSAAERGGGVRSKAIRLSFDTPMAVWPYREPSDAPVPSARSLRLFVVSTSAREARSEDGRVVGECEFLGELPPSILNDAAPDLHGPLWLTTLHDSTLIRSGGDLTFLEASDSMPYQRTEVVQRVRPIPVPLELLVPTGLVSAAMIVLTRRKRLRTLP